MTDRFIRCQPTKSDAELAAERDLKHRIEVATWMAAFDSDTRLCAEMRYLAGRLKYLNSLYEHNIDHGTWSPLELLREAEYLEKNP